MRVDDIFCDAQSIASQFREFIEEPAFPCVGAKSALARGSLKIVSARDIRSAWNDIEIHDELLEWTRAYREEPGGLRSLAVVFAEPARLSESEFESCMWERLQSLADKDVWREQPYDRRVSPNPDDPHFALSFGGEAYFAVGLHPGAARPARRFAYPAIVFNLHDQFERLREEGRYERMRERIIERDVKLAGSPNPMLVRHGEASAAAQYSGRIVPGEWRCPFADPRDSA
ncbi:MAG: guanitoxin biosynthesis heme-dependent pre-guanitoxin N-hydroxylase GntA [Qipengyuania sp.]